MRPYFHFTGHFFLPSMLTRRRAGEGPPMLALLWCSGARLWCWPSRGEKCLFVSHFSFSFSPLPCFRLFSGSCLEFFISWLYFLHIPTFFISFCFSSFLAFSCLLGFLPEVFFFFFSWLYFFYISRLFIAFFFFLLSFSSILLFLMSVVALLFVVIFFPLAEFFFFCVLISSYLSTRFIINFNWTFYPVLFFCFV